MAIASVDVALDFDSMRAVSIGEMVAVLPGKQRTNNRPVSLRDLQKTMGVHVKNW
jgi:hypothetical protein